MLSDKVRCAMLESLLHTSDHCHAIRLMKNFLRKASSALLTGAVPKLIFLSAGPSLKVVSTMSVGYGKFAYYCHTFMLHIHFT